MCGIAGLFYGKSLPNDIKPVLGRMLSSIQHRGPDDQGEWFDDHVALGHRRLSIVDLSPLGHQPMLSSSGRYMLVYNGEIYNHMSLRKELEQRGGSFRGYSDTETLLAMIEYMGLEAALRRCIGMFAIALWDRECQTLTLARDRMGEKPLYFSHAGSLVAFASELKALRVVPGIGFSVNANAVRDVLSNGFISNNLSILSGVGQVRPGELIEFRYEAGALSLRESQFWSASETVLNAVQNPFQGSFEDSVTAVTQLLSDAVGLQMQADVPLGAFLSGGIDSSLIVALMQKQAKVPVRTYSIGFHDKALDEASFARAVAMQLGTQHTEWYVSESEVLSLVPELSRTYDEPLADPSQLPTLVLAKLTRNDVTVALSGDGADELFGGYPKYWNGPALYQRPGRRLIGAGANAFNELIGRPALRALPAAWMRRLPLHRVESMALLFSAGSQHEFIERFNQLNRGAQTYLSPGLRDSLSSLEVPSWTGQLSLQREAMLTDAMNYLPGDILVKVDRATMQASLESRAPFLDHRVFEFAATLPPDYLYGHASGKRILREALSRLVPRELIDRPKAGFTPPIGRWLRGGLKDWAHSLLSDSQTEDLLDVRACRRLLNLHCDSQFDLSARLWPILSIADWYREAKVL